MSLKKYITESERAQAFMVEGDDRMSFGGEEPDWEKKYRS